MATAAVALRPTDGALGNPPQTPRRAAPPDVAPWLPPGVPDGTRELLPLLDVAGVALVLVDPAGRSVASTTAFDRLLAAGSGRRLLWNTARQLVDELHAVPVRIRRTRAAALSIEREVTTPDGRCYRIAAAIPRPGERPASEDDGWALVTVRPMSGSLSADLGAPLEHPLTDRERQVADLLAEGHTTAATARALGISPHTARHHAERVYEKLGVKSRASLGARLAQLAAREAAPVMPTARRRPPHIRRVP